MKRKLLEMSLLLVIVSSLVLGGCSKEMATSAETESQSVFDDIKYTEGTTEKIVAESTYEKEAEVSTEKNTEHIEKTTESIDSKELASNTRNISNKSASTDNSSSDDTSTPAPETEHVHCSVPVWEVVHHEAVTREEDHGHRESVVMEEGHEEPNMIVGWICKTCYYRDGTVVVLPRDQDPSESEIYSQHFSYHWDKGDGLVQWGDVEYQDGTKWVPTVYTDVWVPDIVIVTVQEAYDEKVLKGFQCECGYFREATDEERRVIIPAE